MKSKSKPLKIKSPLSKKLWTFIYPLSADELEQDDGGFQEAREDDWAKPFEDGREAERDDQDPGGEPGDRVAKCQFFLHRPNLLIEILPQEKRVNRDKFNI